MRPQLRTRSALGLILLAGTALRLYRLGADSLWYDETVSTFLAGSRLPELLRHTAGDIHPPGYYVLLRGWLMLMGYPTGHADAHGIGLEFSAAFFSLFFGILLIALVYALARRVANHQVGLIAALLVAFSPYNVWYSQEVRMYTLGAALGVVVVYALAQIADGKWQIANGRRQTDRRQAAFWWAVYAVAAAAGMYTLYYFIFLLIPLNVWVLWQIAYWQMANGKWQIASLPPRPESRFHACSADSPVSSFQPPASSLAPRQPRRCIAIRTMDSSRLPTGDQPARPAVADRARPLACAARELDSAQPGPVGAELAVASAVADAGVVWTGVGGAVDGPSTIDRRPTTMVCASSFVHGPSSPSLPSARSRSSCLFRW